MPLPYHIVIAESNDAVRALLVRVIGRAYPSATLSAVADGIYANQIVSQRGADLLITSTQLARLNGPSLIRLLRSQRAPVPILLLSTDPAMAYRGAQLGADRFLLKPFTLLELQEATDSLLP